MSLARQAEHIPLASMEELEGPLEAPGPPARAQNGCRPLPRASMSPGLPRDRLNGVYLVLLFHGIGILLPWNMFITAKTYFVDYKLNSTEPSIQEFRNNFLSYIGVASQIPNLIFCLISLFIPIRKGSVTTRVIGTIIVEVLIFILTIVLGMMDSADWSQLFFYMTLGSVIIINMANGIYQSTVYGVAAKFPKKYTSGVILGTSLSGTLVALLNILTLAVAPNPKTAGIYFFIGALLILLICFDTIFALPLSRFYRYYIRLENENLSNGHKAKREQSKPRLGSIFKKIWPECYSSFMNSFVSLAVFPAVLANIDPLDPDFIIPSLYFTPIMCYLLFNFFSMVGNMFGNCIRCPSPKFLWLLTTLRLAFIPLFTLCNYKPDVRKMAVIITNDWAFGGMSILLGLTNGFVATLCMVYARRRVGPEYAPMAAMLTALFLIMGMFLGANFSFFLTWLVENVSF